jgi:hypothetical protein
MVYNDDDDDVEILHPASPVLCHSISTSRGNDSTWTTKHSGTFLSPDTDTRAEGSGIGERYVVSAMGGEKVVRRFRASQGSMSFPSSEGEGDEVVGER